MAVVLVVPVVAVGFVAVAGFVSLWIVGQSEGASWRWCWLEIDCDANRQYLWDNDSDNNRVYTRG